MYLVESVGGLDLLEELQKVPNMVLCNRAADLIEKYIGVEEDETV